MWAHTINVRTLADLNGHNWTILVYEGMLFRIFNGFDTSYAMIKFNYISYVFMYQLII